MHGSRDTYTVGCEKYTFRLFITRHHRKSSPLYRRRKMWTMIKRYSKLDGRIMWNEHTTTFGSKRSAICAQAVYFLHSTMPSVTCLRLSDVSVICPVTYFQFTNSVRFFLPCLSAMQHSGVLVYPISDNLSRYLSCNIRTAQGSDFELILTVKMKREKEHDFFGIFGILLK